MNNSLGMVDRAEIEQLEPFLKEKVRQQMTQTIIHTSTLYWYIIPNDFVYLPYPKREKIGPHTWPFLQVRRKCGNIWMNNSLGMVDRAEIEQLEPFLKEKAWQQMTQTLLLICAHYHRQKSRP